MAKVETLSGAAATEYDHRTGGTDPVTPMGSSTVFILFRIAPPLYPFRITIHTIPFLVNRWEWINKMLPPSMISWRTCAGRNLCGLVLVWWCWAAYYSAPVPRGRQLYFALPEEVPRWGNDMDLFACILINYIVYLSIYILIYYDLFVYLFIYCIKLAIGGSRTFQTRPCEMIARLKWW